MNSEARQSVEILGVRVDALTAPEAVARIRRGIQDGKRLHVVTVNPEMIMRARHDSAYRKILNGADLCLADGMGTIWAAHYLSRPHRRGPLPALRAYGFALWWLLMLAIWPARLMRRLPGTVPGSDLVRDLTGMCEEFEYRPFLLGAAPGVAVAAAEELQEEFPEVRIAGATAGSPRAADDASVRREVAAAEAEVLFVAYGVPKQEQWISRNLPKLPRPIVAVGVGGSFDYLARAASLEGGSAAKPPPGIVRRRGFEWLWRLITQPSRRRRVLTAFPLFVRAVVRDARLDK